METKVIADRRMMPELVQVEYFDAPTERGEGGFGSTGKLGDLYDSMDAEG